MKLNIVALSVLLASAEARNWFGGQPAYNDWSNSNLERWLEDHKVPNPGNLNRDQLVDLVHRSYQSSYDTWSDSDISSYLSKHSLLPTPTPSTRQRVLDTIRRSYDETASAWDETDLRAWLEDHGLKPKPKSTREELLESVQANWDSARTYVAQQTKAAQKQFSGGKGVTDSIVDSWTDSQLRAYLLEHGIISPASKREELIVLAKQNYNSAGKTASTASKSVSSAYAAATDAASETLSSAWYAATDAPQQAYDYTAAKLNDASDYVYSTWTDNQLRDYLVEKGVIKSNSKAKRDELLTQMSQTYNNAATNVYDTWSDNRIRSWLQSHGVIKSKTAANRDELVDLISRNYYGARDTTYHFWNDNAIRSWLESRGLIEPSSTKKPEELRKLIADNYYSLRDSAYQTYDDNYLRHTLEKAGIINTPAQAKRDEYVLKLLNGGADAYQYFSMLKTLKTNYYGANDYVWDTWSDAKMRSELVANKVIDSAKATDLKRHDLEKLLEQNYAKAESNWKSSDMRSWLTKNNYMKSDAQATADDIASSFKANFNSAASKTNAYLGWSDARIRGWLREHNIPVPMGNNRGDLIQAMRENYVSTQNGLQGLLSSVQEWISSGVHVAEDQIQQALHLLGGAVGTGVGYGEEAGLRAKYGAVSGTAEAKSIATAVSSSASSAISAASASMTSLSSSASSAAKVASSSAASAAASYSKSAVSAASVASASASSAASVASKSASSAAHHASNSSASKSATSLASAMSSSASSVGSSASSSASSAAASYSASATSLASQASASASSLASSLSSSVSRLASLASQSASSISASASSAAAKATAKVEL